MSGSEVILTADRTNLMNHNATFLSGFLASLPRERIPRTIRWIVERIIFPKITPKNGQLRYAVYGLRKIEAALIENGMKVSVLPDHALDRLNDSTRVIGVSAMDPLGIGPATSTAVGLFGGTAFNRYFFEEMMERLSRFDCPKIVGGTGAWQFKLFPEEIDRFGIDCVLIGDGEALAPSLFKKAIKGEKLSKIVVAPPYKAGSYNPTIKNPSFWGFVELSRGCDRHCQFCDPTMRDYHWMPMDKILEEARINTVKGGTDTVTLHSEDVFRYGCGKGEWTPNDKLIKLIVRLKSQPRVEKIFFTHGALAGPAANPKNIEKLSDVLNLLDNPSGIQVGIETGSPRLIDKYMRGKPKPYNPEQWPDIVISSFEILTRNGLIPAATLVVGLPGEEQKDIVHTLELVERLKEFPSIIVPLFFVPLGVLKEKKGFFIRFKDMTDEVQELYVKCGEHILSWARKWASGWQGEMGWVPKMILWLGGACMFRGSEAVKKHEKITKRKISSWVIEEASYYLSRTIEGWQKTGFTYKDFALALKRRRSEVSMPKLEKRDDLVELG
nr:radical SAM protein [Candidatus Njordarchaeota archaeon]